MARRETTRRRGFTLVELLVVVGILATLAGVLVPTLQSAHKLAEASVCSSNIRLLQQANQMYARQNRDFYAPAAPWMYPVPGQWSDKRINNVRWFGRRERGNEPFGREDGPLSPYLPHKMVKGCPSFREFDDGFEAGCGGYGYNSSFVGQHVVWAGEGRYRPVNDRWHLSGNRVGAFAHPYETVAFTDTALVSGGLIEYSFCEPPSWPFQGGTPRPSIHFRHLGKTNIVWLDGHVGQDAMTFSSETATNKPYAGSPADYDVGWFGPKSNELFDLR